MKFLLLGIDAETARLARAIAADEQHRLVGILVDDTTAQKNDRQQAEIASLRGLAPLSEIGTDFEGALAGAQCVIVAYHDDDTVLRERIGRLLSLGIPVIVTHPVSLSVFVHYELEILAREATAACLPYLPTREHPALRQLRSQLGTGLGSPAAGCLGPIEQVTFERALRDTTLRGVLRALAADVDLIRQIGGEMDEVSAMRADDAARVAVPVNVQMAGPAGILVRWSAAAATKVADGRVAIQGRHGRAELTLAEDGTWTLDVGVNEQSSGEQSSGGQSSGEQSSGEQSSGEQSSGEQASGERWPPSQTWQPKDTAQAAITSLVRQIADWDRGGGDDGRWQQPARCLELAEAAASSMRKGRTVRLQYDGRGEASNFKGMMASMGCALLVAGLGVMIAAALLLKMAKVQGLDQLAALVSKAPYALLALLIVFLLLQLLRLLIPGRQETD